MSVVPIVIGAVVVVVVVCCLVGVILGLLGVIALPGLTPAAPTATPTATPTYTPQPTHTPPSTQTPRPSETPLPPPTPTKRVVVVPTPTEGLISGGMKTYSSTKFGFSIQYPADWTMTESNTGPIFSGSKVMVGATIGAIPSASALGDEKALTNLFVAQLKSTFTDLKVVSEDTRTFKGVEWRYLLITGSYSGLSTKWDLYAKIHTTTGTGYVFVGFAGVTSYDEQTLTFSRMMETFTFLQ